MAVDEIQERLRVIVPEGIPDREYAITKTAARTAYAALYVGAVEGQDRWLAPRHVYRLSDDRAAIDDVALRDGFYRKPPPSGQGAWYADNSREGVRDEGLRQGLIPLNAIVVNPAVRDATSSRGRYALTAAFAALLDPALTDAAFRDAALAWGARYLSPAARARAAYVQGSGPGAVEIRHPQGGALLLAGGVSAVMTKAVIEVFAGNFLTDPQTVWISDSRAKVFDNPKMVKLLDLRIDAARLLPDVILVDLAPAGRPGRLLIVFVEIVFSDGPITAGRRTELLKLLEASGRGFTADDATFVTVYKDRAAAPAARAARALAWGSFAWFVSEPQHLVQFHRAHSGTLAELL